MPWPKGRKRPKSADNLSFTKIDIDPDQVRKLALIQCTMEEIASIVNCSVDTLENRFSEIIKKAKEEGKASLRRTQIRLMEEGSATMGIWLGKVYLKQKEEQEVDPKAIASLIAYTNAIRLSRDEDPPKIENASQ